MKRKREVAAEKKGCSEIKSAIEELTLLVKLTPNDQQDDHDNSTCATKIPTLPFLSICSLVLQVLDKIGPTMTVLRKDIHQNIQRLEKLIISEPSVYSNVVEILKKEKKEGSWKKRTSCSKAFVWLTRSLEFTATLLRNLAEDLVQSSLEETVEEAYKATLKSLHGWISSAAFKVCLKLLPEKEVFLSLLMSECNNYDALKEDINAFNALLLPLLDDTNSLLVTYRLDKIRST